MSSSSMLVVYLLFIVGLAGVVKGGDWLVGGAAWFARIFGIPQMIVGATIVSIGTTLPETMIGVMAALAGNGGIITGTAIGSVLCNTGLVLGLSTFLLPTVIKSRDTFFKIGSMVGVLILLAVLAGDHFISRFDSFILVLLLAAYVGANIWAGSNHNNHNHHTYTRKQLAKQSVLFFLGVVMLVLGARLLLDNGIAIARHFGISEVVIAVTLFAGGSSLPELVTTITAALKGHSHIGLGNIIGANTLNIIMVIGISGLVRPFAVPQTVTAVDIPITIILMLILIGPAFYFRRIRRIQGAAALLGYVAYLVYMILNY